MIEDDDDDDGDYYFIILFCTSCFAFRLEGS